MQIETSTLAFDKAVNTLLDEYGLEMRDLMHEQMRLNVNSLIKYTPPGNAKAGKSAVLHDYSMLFASMPERSLERYRDRYKTDPTIAKSFKPMSMSAMRDHHRSQRDSRGRVREQAKIKFKVGRGKRTKELYSDKQHINPQAYRQYLKTLLADVGKTAAGWLGGGNPFGGKGPAFVMRQRSKWGSAIDAMKADGSGYLEVTNSVKWVSRYERELEQLVGRIRKADLERSLKLTIERIAKRFSQNQPLAA